MMDLPDTEEELAARPELVATGQTLDLIKAIKKFFAPTDHDVERVVEGGGRILRSPQSHLYLDRPYAAGFAPPEQAEAAERLGFANYRPGGVEHAASWDPAAHAIPDSCVAGVEATVFAEQFKGFDDVTVLLLPRLASVAEAAWCGRVPDWAEYRERLARHGRVWERLGLNYFASTEVPWVA
ncbi:family 20 glycosylhydrolase [Streptomyces sp. NPDC002809]|uniref:family 20 glycosylhydrolase n=1 Tax=Streptomyces sp. NPDC002809 TaxID=3154433 RepID=UPI00331B9D4B